MGAIAGVMPRDGRVDRETLTGMLAALRDAMGRRGPVEGGMAVAYDASIGLAHRAGEGPGGESVLQPLTNESGTLWLVADGEPSNAAELRLELIGAGHRFCSACGSEVILHLYEQDGPHALARLAGAFAFALWDRTQRQLVLGRDRAGERPLYIAEEAGVLRFASEARALAAEPGITPAGAAAFLTLGYLPEPLTVAPAVRALRPGTILRTRGARSRRESFWEDAASSTSGDLQDDRLRVGRVLREAIQDAVAGEEGVGIAFTGELPDTALLALTSPVVGRGLRTHTFVFESAATGARVSRRWRTAAEHARVVATWFRSEHCEHHVGPERMARAFAAAADADQPSVGAPLAHLLAAHVAASGDRILLSGAGGEELIGLPRGAWLPWVWRAGRYGATRAPARVAAALLGRLRPFGGAAAVADALARPDALVAAHLGAHAVVVPRALPRLLRPEVLEHARATFDPAIYVRGLIDAPLGPPSLVVSASARAAAMRVVTAIERAGPLTSGRLRDAEHAAAIAGLGFRAPYLDHRLVEWACGPNSRGHAADVIVRELLRASVPAPFRRRTMHAPPPPLAAWMRAELRPLVEDHLFGDDREGYFVAAGVEALWKRFLAGGAPAAPVWAVAVLRAWIRAWRTRACPGAATRRRAAA